MIKIETSDFIVEFEDSEEVKSKVFAKLVEYYLENESFSGEEIMQCDRSLIEAPQVLSDIADDIIDFKVVWK